MSNKEFLTEIIAVVDRSGSMGSVTDETIEGFNAFIRAQREDKESDADVTLVLFDDEYKKPYDCVPIKEFPYLDHKTYVPRGCTALLDAIGKTVNEAKNRIRKTRERARPDKVIVVILTDGHENASKRYKKSDVFRLIRRQEEKHNWEFIFLGAGQDSIAEARSYGIKGTQVSAYTAASGMSSKKAFLNASRAVRGHRSVPAQLSPGEFVLQAGIYAANSDAISDKEADDFTKGV
jgi:uncharacterized protein YegL